MKLAWSDLEKMKKIWGTLEFSTTLPFLVV